MSPLGKILAADGRMKRVHRLAVTAAIGEEASTCASG
jgi:hypothetical protein